MKLVIPTCDRYRWLQPIFKYFLEKNWPDNPYPIEIVTESDHIKLQSLNGTVFYAGRESWASRMISYLKQSKEDKILFILDDHLIKTTVDTDAVRRAEKFLEGDVGCVRLNNGPHKYFVQHSKDYPVIDGFREYPLGRRFSMVVAMAFFQKQFLLDALKDGEDIWESENEGSKRLAKLDSKWRILWPFNNIVDYQNRGGLIRKGRLRTQALKWTLSELSKDKESCVVAEELYTMLMRRVMAERRGEI